MAEAKSEAEWVASFKAIADEVDAKEDFDEVSKSAKVDVVVGSEEENLLVEAVIATISRQLPDLAAADIDLKFLAEVFLRFREYAVVDAVARMGRFLQWRAKFGCNKQTSLSPECKAMLLDGMRTVLPGPDKEGRAILLLQSKYGKPGQDVRLMMQVVHWVCMQMLRRGPTVQKRGFCMIMDQEGGSYKNMDPAFMKEMGPAMRKCFPVRMGQVFIVNPNALADVFIYGFKAMNSEKVGSRVSVVRELGELQKFIDKAQLPPNLGGTLEFDFKAWVEANNK
jgi:hypothetical protein